ncbi:MAG: biosynthetic arginine decarboxylase [Phycisphaerales bacterium]
MSTTSQSTRAAEAAPPWSIADAAELYRVDAWGGGWFRVNDAGHMCAVCAGLEVDLVEVVEGLRARGVGTPVLLRLTDILDGRLRQLRDAFANAMRENGYRGAYRGVYPIKVNQQHHVVSEVAEVGRQLGFGLEAGSKPELLAVVAMTSGDDGQLIICNGFKDERYIDMAVLAKKLGRSIVPVVENLDELRLILQSGERYGVRPDIGVRVKLSATGAGRWKDSAGTRSKFGLFVSEAMEVIDMLRERGMLDCLKLLHCHVGSQIQDIGRIKDSVTELAHIYVEMSRLGAGLEMIDVGGGLGVDYRGEQVNDESSMNYTLEEFASDMVYRITATCDEAGVEHPSIVTECGRAMVAYSSVLIFDILGATGPERAERAGNGADETPRDDDPQPIRDLRGALSMATGARLDECYHDAKKALADATSSFRLGYMTLEERALAERLYWRVCRRLRESMRGDEEYAEELAELDAGLAEVYFANFSLFQSLPDSWAIDQLFPIMPIHRLDEKPTRKAIIGDLTCDSDGRIDRFVAIDGPTGVLDVHELKSDPYYMGAFLVGAYQETLGDLHNLFGDAHAVHLRVVDGKWSIGEIVRGDTSSEVLTYLQHNPEAFQSQMAKDCDRAVRTERMTPGEAGALMKFYESSLSGYTYFERAGGEG